MNKITKIKDLVARLQECDPDGNVALSLDGALLYDDEEFGDIEYSFEVTVDCLFSQAHSDRSDRVYIRLSEEDTARIVNRRRLDCGDSDQSTACVAASQPEIALDAPVAVAIAMSREAYTDVVAVVESCNRADQSSGGATTHGKMDISKLIAMLVEDLAMTNSRPGCWEAANMQQVLDSHGYS